MVSDFIDSLTTYTRATDNFEYGTQVYKKENALKKKYIHMNMLYKHYIVIDIDEPNSVFFFEERNLPVPTIITINPENGKCHYLYQLKTPVIYTEAARRRPQAFYEAIDCSLTRALTGDIKYIGRMTKNPLHPAWKLIQHNVQYDLNDFQEWVDIRSSRKNEIDVVPGAGRNCTLFDTTRIWAYVEVFTHSSYYSFKEAVESKAFNTNTMLFEDSLKGELPYKEVLSISNSISKWTWGHRHEIGKKCNRGVMADQFEPNTPLVVKQMLSAERSNEVRKQSSFEKILISAKALKAQGSIITKNSVSIHSGLSFDTVKKYWKELNTQINTYGIS